MEIMNEREIMKAAMRGRGLKQSELARRMDTTDVNLSACMNRVRTSVDVFREVMDALEYDIVIVDRRTGEREYKLEM